MDDSLRAKILAEFDEKAARHLAAHKVSLSEPLGKSAVYGEATRSGPELNLCRFVAHAFLHAANPAEYERLKNDLISTYSQEALSQWLAKVRAVIDSPQSFAPLSSDDPMNTPAYKTAWEATQMFLAHESPTASNP